MLGHLYTLLLVGSSEAPPAPPPSVSGGWPTLRRERRKNLEPWQEELERLFAKPEPEVEVQPVEEAKPAPVAVGLTKSQRAYIDGLYASIVRAKNEQERARRMALVATAEREALEAQAMLAVAVEAERVAKRQMMDFDIAFVATVLASM